MRCDEVMRELNLPSDDRDNRALAHHLAECKACARWAEHAARFNRLWDATRPVDPPTESWDRLWSSVTARLDHSGPVTTPHSRPDNSFAAVGDAAHSSTHRRSLVPGAALPPSDWSGWPRRLRCCSPSTCTGTRVTRTSSLPGFPRALTWRSELPRVWIPSSMWNGARCP